MKVHEQQAKTLLTKGKRVDSWFGCRYSLNLYRGCAHNCAYCDGRSERYYVEGDFSEDIVVKVNAPELLQQELEPRPRRKSWTPGWVVFGGGVADSYQPLEMQYQLSRRCLEALEKFRMPVHMLTKSAWILRDRDWIEKMRHQGTVIVSFSFSSCDAEMSAIVEPGLPGPRERLEAMAALRKFGVPCGALLMPIIPFLSDTPEMLDATIRSIKEAGAQYLLFSSMTLKPGRQKDHYLEQIQHHYPKLVSEYDRIYPPDPWGHPIPAYTRSLTRRIIPIARKYQIPLRIPLSFFASKISEWDQITILLEQIDALNNFQGNRSQYSKMLWKMEPWKIPLSFALTDPVFTAKLDPKTAQILREYVDTGACREYDQLLRWTTV